MALAASKTLRVPITLTWAGRDRGKGEARGARRGNKSREGVSTHAGWHRHLGAEHGVGAAGGDLQTSQVDDGGGLGLDDNLLGERRVGNVACGRG